MTHQPRRLLAGSVSAAVVLAPAAGSAACLALALRSGLHAVSTSDPALALLALAAAALAVVLAWATLAAAAGVAEAWSDAAGSRRPHRPRVRPAPARGRAAVVSTGVAALVVAALTAPAASAAAAARPSPAPVVLTEDTGATWADAAPDPPPGQPTDRSQPGSWSALAEEGFRAPRGASVGAASLVTAQASRGAPAAAAPEVVVLAGDSLWSIAEHHLGPGADPTEVAEAWPRWWEANRAVVGEDPHLLLPGQRLVAPAP